MARVKEIKLTERKQDLVEMGDILIVNGTESSPFIVAKAGVTESGALLQVISLKTGNMYNGTTVVSKTTFEQAFSRWFPTRDIQDARLCKSDKTFLTIEFKE